MIGRVHFPNARFHIAAVLLDSLRCLRNDNFQSDQKIFYYISDSISSFTPILGSFSTTPQPFITLDGTPAVAVWFLYRTPVLCKLSHHPLSSLDTSSKDVSALGLGAPLLSQPFIFHHHILLSRPPSPELHFPPFSSSTPPTSPVSFPPALDIRRFLPTVTQPSVNLRKYSIPHYPLAHCSYPFSPARPLPLRPPVLVGSATIGLPNARRHLIVFSPVTIGSSHYPLHIMRRVIASSLRSTASPSIGFLKLLPPYRSPPSHPAPAATALGT